MNAIEARDETTRRSRRWFRGLAVIGLGIAVGLGVAFGPRLFDDASADSERAAAPSGAVGLASLSTRQVAAATASAGDALAVPPVAAEGPDAPAASPADAVTAFLTAETTGRFDVSYGLLGAADRTRVGGRVAWTASHANLPPIVGFTIGDTAVSGAEATVMTQLDLQSSLDEVVGLIPAHAEGRWITVAEDGGWRVAYSQSRLVPRYPSDALVADAAREWVAARQACRTAAEWSGGLVDSGAVARKLCDKNGAVDVGAATRLPDDTSASSLSAAFGPDVSAWARLVPITGPARLDLIVAPIGERWLVIGARTASASAS